MYYYMDVESPPSGTVRHILRYVGVDAVQSFPNVDSNLGPERAAYLAWVAEGNTPLPWPPVS